MSAYLRNWLRLIWSRRPDTGRTITARRGRRHHPQAMRTGGCSGPFPGGGTQANLTVIASALRSHQGAVGAVTAHINVHETGSIEATGH